MTRVDRFRKLNSPLFRYDVAAFLLCIVFFLIWPDFDLYVSRHFYDESAGGFFWNHTFVAEFIYTATDVIAGVAIFGLPTAIVAGWLSKKEFLVRRRRALVFVFTVLVVGPGLVVNAALKDHWDRPRPRQVVEFGGERTYEPPFNPSFACDNCHSFVSGHASIGFFFFSLALLSRKRKWLWLPVIAGSVIGATRIVQGGHFFSDVVFSGWAVWFCSLILYAWFFEPKKYGEDPPGSVSPGSSSA